jgi:hypothetical protein
MYGGAPGYPCICGGIPMGIIGCPGGPSWPGPIIVGIVGDIDDESDGSGA